MRRANLMLHTGANAVDRAMLDAIPTPTATETWFPIPHTSLLEQVQTKLAASGLQVISESHGLTKDGLRYFGLLQVQPVNEDDGDFGLVVGVRNSHDMTFPAGLVLGSQVFVCDNLAFSGEVKLSRKHTRFIMRDLPQLVEVGVGRLTHLKTTQETRLLTYKQAEVSDREAHDLVIRALDAQVITATKVPDVLEEWRNPRHPEFVEAGKTLWRLFNGFTEVAKGTNLATLPRRTQALHGLMDAHCGLLVNPTAIPDTIADAEIVVAPQPA